MNFIKRHVSTKSLISSQDLEEVRTKFQGELLEAVELHEVPADLIFNWDQTGILLVPSAQWTMDEKGRKRIPIASHYDKWQITAVMCGALLERWNQFNLSTKLPPRNAIRLTNFLMVGLLATALIIG